MLESVKYCEHKYFERVKLRKIKRVIIMHVMVSFKLVFDLG